MKPSPTERYQSWDSELPSFVQKDIRYAQKNGYNIKYTFNENSIYLYEHKNKWYVSMYQLFNDFTLIEDLTNFSIYKRKDENNNRFIDIYGYDNYITEKFCLVYISKKISSFNILSTDYNIPFNLQNLLYSKSFGEFSLVNDLEENFSFYKNCELISSQKFSMGKIKKIDWNFGLILTEKNDLYIMFIEKNNGVPILKFYYITSIDELPQDSNSFYSFENLYSKEEDIQLPIIIKNGKYYVLIPEDLDTYKYASIYYSHKNIKEPEKLNYNFSIVELKDCFKFAKFEYHSDKYYGIWKIDLVFSLNGYKFHKQYEFNGYEHSIILDKDSVKLFEKTIYSFEDIWENIEKIRLEYFDYYDHGWG